MPIKFILMKHPDSENIHLRKGKFREDPDKTITIKSFFYQRTKYIKVNTIDTDEINNVGYLQ